MLGWARANTSGIRVRVIRTLDDAAVVIGDLRVFAQVASEFLAEVAKLPIAQGKLVTFTMDGTGSAMYFDHGLPGAYRGAFHAGQTDTLNPVTLMSPDEVLSNGQDPRLVFGARPSAATTAVVGAWVF